MATSIRLDPFLGALLRRIARQSGCTESEVLRKALLRFAEERHVGEAPRPFDRVAHLLGCVRGGPPDLSARTGRRFFTRLRRASVGPRQTP